MKRMIIKTALSIFVFLIAAALDQPAAAADSDILRDIGSPIDSSPAIGSDGTVYVGADNGYLYATDMDGSATRKEVFISSLLRTVSPAIAADGTVYMGSANGKLVSATPSGDTASIGVGSGAVSTPAIAENGAVYVGSGDFSLYAFDADGNYKWSFSTGGAVTRPAVGGDGTVYAGSADGFLYAVIDRGDSGDEKWRFNADGPATAPIIGSDGTIYMGSDGTAGEGFVYAIGDDGQQDWKRRLDGMPSAPVIGRDGHILIGTAGNFFYSYDSDGELQWQIETGGPITASAAVGADGTIYIPSTDGMLHALLPDDKGAAADGWPKDLNVGASSPAIDADGVLYIGARDGKLLAIGTDSGGLADSAWPMFGRNLRHTGRAARTSDGGDDEDPDDGGPVADAGEDRKVEEEDNVELDGTDSRGEDLSYSWSQTGGDSVDLEDADTATASFTAPELEDDEDIVLTFNLTVTDADGQTDTDAVAITVEEGGNFCFIQTAAGR